MQAIISRGLSCVGVLCISAIASLPVSAQEESAGGFWNPFKGWSTSTTKTSASEGGFSGKPVTLAPPESSMPIESSETSDQWSWPKIPTPKWQAPNWSLPKPSWPSWMSSSKASQTSKPPTVSNWNRSTRRWWKNTTSMLNPFSSSESTKSRSPNTGWGGGYSSSDSQDTQFEYTWFPWLDPPAENEKPQTPNDFFRQPQP